jgi:hypothetical protein
MCVIPGRGGTASPESITRIVQNLLESVLLDLGLWIPDLPLPRQSGMTKAG